MLQSNENLSKDLSPSESKDNEIISSSSNIHQHQIHKKDQSIIADESISKYIQEKKEIYSNLMKFLEYSDNDDNYFQQLIDVFNNQGEDKFRIKIEEFLQLISIISDNHHREETFFTRIFQIIQNYKEEIKQTLSNIELFNIFQNNKKILLYLFKNKILLFDDQIYKEIIWKTDSKGNGYCHFFYPEIKEFHVHEETIENIKKEILLINPNIFDHFEENREKGENDSYICSLIREDSVQEFISYVNRSNIQLNSEVKYSIFETNSFLTENLHTTLIEYSAFFGSIQIFRYLLMNKVQLKPSLWLYSIHSNNAELIHLLETYEILPMNGMYDGCLIESIKCHHNAIAEYIESNLLTKIDEQNSDILSNIMKYHNYSYFPFNIENRNEFCNLNFYGYFELVDLFIKKKEESIKQMILDEILKSFILII